MELTHDNEINFILQQQRAFYQRFARFFAIPCF